MGRTVNKTLVAFGAVLVVGGLLVLVLVLVPWLSGNGSMSMMGDMDRHFIEEMIPHHQDAVEMAELGLTEAEHSELRDLAERVIDNQSREIDDMERWYLAWYGTEVPEDGDELHGFGMMGGGMMHDEADLEVLRAAEDFDREFIKQMIPHHQMGVMMARMVLAQTDRPEIETLAEAIIETQNSEIELMRDWYSEWYE